MSSSSERRDGDGTGDADRRRTVVLFAVGGMLVLGALFALTVGVPDLSRTQAVSEPAADEPVPTADDPFFEAAAEDGSWVSYHNPRDEYRDPYLGNGSGKICVTLLNERGEPVVGESVPNTTVTIPTGESLAWHTAADPIVVEFPLTEAYVRPLDSDQFGTDEDHGQGDGLLDAHCVEWHGLPEDGTVEYGEASIEGEHAEDVAVVGYVTQVATAWDSTVDPIEDAVGYETAGGRFTYEPDGSHGQTVVVLQLEGEDASQGDDAGEAGGGGVLERLESRIGLGAIAGVVASLGATVRWGQ